MVGNMETKFNFFEYLKNRGFTVEASWGGAWGKGEGLHYRAPSCKCNEHIDEPKAHRFEIWWGVEECFDNWGNSTNFVSSIPKTKEAADDLMKTLRSRLEEGKYDPYGPKTEWL
jgi:hypothetical protein